MRFYEKALGGKLEVLMSGAGSPIAEHMPKEFAHRILHARLVLPGGGQVTMPMQPAFWAKQWGMLVDKFGTPWIVNGELIPI
jgi:PhnB protein